MFMLILTESCNVGVKTRIWSTGSFAGGLGVSSVCLRPWTMMTDNRIEIIRAQSHLLCLYRSALNNVTETKASPRCVRFNQSNDCPGVFWFISRKMLRLKIRLKISVITRRPINRLLFTIIVFSVSGWLEDSILRLLDSFEKVSCLDQILKDKTLTNWSMLFLADILASSGSKAITKKK